MAISAIVLDPLVLAPAPRPAMGTVNIAKGDLPRAPKRAADPLILVRMSLVLKITPIPLITIEERDRLDPIGCMSLAPKANPPGSTAKSDEARFHAHINAQAKSLRSSSDALRQLQANTACLEAQATSNEESAVLRANTVLADTQRRLKEAQARITTGVVVTPPVDLSEDDKETRQQLQPQAAMLLNRLMTLLQQSVGAMVTSPNLLLVVGVRTPRTSLPLHPKADGAMSMQLLCRKPLLVILPLLLSVRPQYYRQNVDRTMVERWGGVQPDHYSVPGVRARQEATCHNNDADIVCPIPFVQPDNFNNVREWLAYFEQSPGERPLGVPLESSLEQIDIIQVWLWINTAAAPLSREDCQLFSTSTLSLMWTPGTFANYRQANLCEEVFDITHFSGDPTSPDQVLEYWNDTGITLDQAAMFTQFYNYHSAAQAHPATRCPARRGTKASITDSTPTASTSGQRNPSTDIPRPLATDDPMGERVDYGDDNSTDGDISLSPKALALGQMGMALTAIAMVVGIIPPDPEGRIAPSLEPVVDTRSLVDDDHN
ncbi:hypothetical protein JAAARDRAFT_199099 [Jaapia argillacea MUCL 33604]|uniref:Uncharacterized protein n=1 Tax=Jaapia argillacea MUCL 33604 TaxID=933084 RepID=A0A067P9P0_9AGAM|nr:hypothetical protein JAAARDRAFT_199099 [Jaapia argillacea MUCL 33604]